MVTTLACFAAALDASKGMFVDRVRQLIVLPENLVGRMGDLFITARGVGVFDLHASKTQLIGELIDTRLDVLEHPDEQVPLVEKLIAILRRQLGRKKARQE